MGAGHLWILMFAWGMNQRWNDIWNGSYMNCGYEIKWSYDPRSYERNFCNCVKNPEKFRISTGFEPVTSWYRCNALTNWAMKPLTLGAGHLWILMFAWGMNQRWNGMWNGSYMNRGYEIKWSYDPRSYERNFCNCVKNPEKFRTSTGYWTRDLAIPVRRSNQLSHDATDVGSGSFVDSNVHVRNKSTMKWYMKWIIYELRIWNQVELWSSQLWTHIIDKFGKIEIYCYSMHLCTKNIFQYHFMFYLDEPFYFIFWVGWALACSIHGTKTKQKQLDKYFWLIWLNNLFNRHQPMLKRLKKHW